MTRTDHSRADMTWACKMANQGLDEEQIVRALSAKPTGRRVAGSMKYMALLDSRGRDAADTYARRTARKAIRFTSDNPQIRSPNDAILKVLAIAEAANCLPWGVYGGAAARRALEAAFVVADRVQRVEFGLSWREWAQLSGQGFDAVRASAGVVEALGWLERNPDDRLGRTARYRLRIPSHIHSQGDWNVGTPTDRVWLGHDAFRRGGLGDDGWLVMAQVQGRTAHEDLRHRTGFSHHSATLIVNRLEDFGLVHVDDDAVWRVDDVLGALDLAAATLGTDGQGRSDRERFEADRRAFRARGDVNVGTPS